MILPTALLRLADDPTPSTTPEPVSTPPPELVDIQLTDPQWWIDVATGPVFRSVMILLGAVVARYLARKIINGFVRGVTATQELPTPKLGAGRSSAEAREVAGEDYLHVERRINRANTLGQMFKNVSAALIWTIAGLMVLGEWGFNLGPLIASAGIVGVALGFGAQSLVSDFLSGVFMLLEDQYGVGDIIEIDGTGGTVEDVQLRVTRLRSVDGVVWWVRNGEVKRVGNMSQNWSRAVLDVGVAYDSDIGTVRRVLSEEAHALFSDEQWSQVLLEEPEVWGVESLGNDSIVVRVVLKTHPGEQWGVARELRERIKVRFDDEGIQIPFPQRTVWIKQEDGPRVVPA